MPENAGLPEEVVAWLAASSCSHAGTGPQAVRARLKEWIPEYVPAQ